MGSGLFWQCNNYYGEMSGRYVHIYSVGVTCSFFCVTGISHKKKEFAHMYESGGMKERSGEQRKYLQLGECSTLWDKCE